MRVDGNLPLAATVSDYGEHFCRAVLIQKHRLLIGSTSPLCALLKRLSSFEMLVEALCRAASKTFAERMVFPLANGPSSVAFPHNWRRFSVLLRAVCTLPIAVAAWDPGISATGAPMPLVLGRWFWQRLAWVGNLRAWVGACHVTSCRGQCGPQQGHRVPRQFPTSNPKGYWVLYQSTQVHMPISTSATTDVGKSGRLTLESFD